MGVFIWEEARTPAPILPLALFRSRTFTAVNLLTLLLYGALGGALFFLPFALIQVEGFSAVVAGAAFLPVTIIMGTLSRWSGGLLDRFGARWLLIVGPSIAALGFGLLVWPIGGGSFWAYLAPIGIMALGMVISAGPITTTVINAVPTHQAGIAAGVDNAVAAVASLLAVAILGALALAFYNGALDNRLERAASEEVKQAIQVAHGQFVTAPALSTVQGNDRQLVEIIIKESLAESIRLIMLLVSLLAFASAACGALIPRHAVISAKGSSSAGRP